MKTVGIKLADGTFYPVMEEGSSQQKTLELTTAHDNQTCVMVDLYRSESCTMEDAEYIDTLKIENLNAHLNGEPDISFNVGLDENGKLSANIVDEETGATSNETNITLISRTMEDRLQADDYTISHSNDTIFADEPVDTTEDGNDNGKVAAAAIGGAVAGAGLLAAVNALNKKDEESYNNEAFSEIQDDADDIVIDEPVEDDFLENETFVEESETNSLNTDDSFDLPDFPSEETISDNVFADNSESADSGDGVADDTIVDDSGDGFADDAIVEDSGDDFTNDTIVEDSGDGFADDALIDNTGDVFANDTIVEDSGDLFANDAIVEDSSDPFANDAIVENSGDPFANDTFAEEPADDSDDSNDFAKGAVIAGAAAVAGAATYAALSNKDEDETITEDNAFASDDFANDTFAENSNDDFTNDTIVEDNSDVFADNAFGENSGDDFANDTIVEDSSDPFANEVIIDDIDNDFTNDTIVEDSGDPFANDPFAENSDDDFTNDTIVEDSSDVFADDTIAEDPAENSDDFNFDMPEENDSLADSDFEDFSYDNFESNGMDESSNFADEPQGNGGISFTGLYDKETEMGDPSATDEDDTKKKTKAPVIICIICAIICLIATALILFIIPSKCNLLTKNGDEKQKTEKVAKAEPAPAPVVEPAATPEPEPAPKAKEEEVIVIEQAETVVPEPPAPKKADPVTYKIKWGDTLWDIADTYYKNPWKYKTIARYNGIKNPDHIISGTTIVIPE